MTLLNVGTALPVLTVEIGVGANGSFVPAAIYGPQWQQTTADNGWQEACEITLPAGRHCVFGQACGSVVDASVLDISLSETSASTTSDWPVQTAGDGVASNPPMIVSAVVLLTEETTIYLNVDIIGSHYVANLYAVQIG